MAVAFRSVALWIATALQWLIRCLESLIELLGQEPDANRSTSRLLEEIGVRFMDPEQGCERAKRLEEKGNDEAALRLYVKVLEYHPDYTPAMDSAAEIMAEMGDTEGARELATRSVELQPDGGYSKYVLLGHLEHGRAAIAAFTTALALLGREHSDLEAKMAEDDAPREVVDELNGVRRRMGAVMAAMAKVYLTDIFSEPQAEQQCEQLLDKALRYDSENPEACQALADLRLTQGRQGEALLLARRTAEVCARLPAGLVPTYDFRMVTARLLVELSDYADAARILEELSREDGEDTEAWYLRGLCLMMLARGKEAREALLRARALVEENPTRDAGLTAQIDQLLARRALSQAEREAVWNPRWWVQDGRAQRAPTGPEPALTRPGDLVVVHNEEDLIDLSPAAQESRAQANGGRGTAGVFMPASGDHTPRSPRPLV